MKNWRPALRLPSFSPPLIDPNPAQNNNIGYFYFHHFFMNYANSTTSFTYYKVYRSKPKGKARKSDLVFKVIFR